MKQVRMGVFETNSSSTHAINICTDGNYQSIDASGTEIILTGGRFGWDQDHFSYFQDKANYLFQRLISTWPKVMVNDQDKLDLLIKVIAEFTGATVVCDMESAGNGYIDHQSWDVPEAALETEQTMKDFLFNPESYFETDNDNH